MRITSSSAYVKLITVCFWYEVLISGQGFVGNCRQKWLMWPRLRSLRSPTPQFCSQDCSRGLFFKTLSLGYFNGFYGICILRLFKFLCVCLRLLTEKDVGVDSLWIGVMENCINIYTMYKNQSYLFRSNKLNVCDLGASEADKRERKVVVEIFFWSITCSLILTWLLFF